jgi:hypothetical protein
LETNNSDWSDLKKWGMGIVAAIIILIIGVVINNITESGKDNTEIREVNLTVVGAKAFEDLISRYNEDVWVYFEAIPENATLIDYKLPVQSELKKYFKKVKFVERENIESQFGFMQSTEWADSQQIWGTAILVINVAENELVIIQSPINIQRITGIFK